MLEFLTELLGGLVQVKASALLADWGNMQSIKFYLNI